MQGKDEYNFFYREAADRCNRADTQAMEFMKGQKSPLTTEKIKLQMVECEKGQYYDYTFFDRVCS